MDDGDAAESRRRFLQLTGAGSVLAATGCLGDPDPITVEDDRPDDWCLEILDDEVPVAERQALSIDGHEPLPPDEILTKAEVAYECGPFNGQQCGNCTYYVDDRTGDGIGACTEVEGQIRSADWCAIWEPREKQQVE